MASTVFLATPPFTQLNTPYPATAYLKGFLQSRGISCYQADIGIEVILKLFTKPELKNVFALASKYDSPFSDNVQRMLTLQEAYINTIESVIDFLQGKQPTLAHLIASRGYLPEADRFAQIDDLFWAFGSMGVQDQAKHLATLYLEDISDLIKECVDPFFGFSRYAEKLARSANQFDELQVHLHKPPTYIDELTIGILKEKVDDCAPILVVLSVPFPGNVYSALRMGHYIKTNYPHVKVALGGGFANTELRSLEAPEVFDYVDFISLDDGEAPLEQLVLYINGQVSATHLKRTFLRKEGKVIFVDNKQCADYAQAKTGTPDYSDLPLDRYISAIEIMNPMHRLWSDGRWNKLTMAHGCYWGKCTFCDISLPYISDYEPIAAQLIVDRMEEIIAQTGNNGFHFVDEAAPPALMRSVAIEILKRKLVVSWWTNIRFEKSFTRNLCLLLKAAGCIAVSGGLEVASDRLLALIQKGITVAQVALVNKNFTEAGIMVHAYLMYGFPTQTEQETIDSLEMVRQLFQTGVLQSAFWHQFTMTAHSPVGLSPDQYQVKPIDAPTPTFANNDVVHIDPTGADHATFSFGLKKSLLNFMHGIGLTEPLHKWFDFKVPKTTVPPDFIKTVLNNSIEQTYKPQSRVLWLGGNPTIAYFVKSKKGQQWPMATIVVQSKRTTIEIKVNDQQGAWLHALLPKLAPTNPEIWTMLQIRKHYEDAGLEDFDLFWDNKPVSTLYKAGLLVV